MKTDPSEFANAPEVAPPEGALAYPIVGVGASAGGLEAYGQLLSALGPETGMAYVVIQHLDPDHESRLVPLLAKATKMPVAEVVPDAVPEPNHVYVIAPNTDVAFERGAFRVTPRERGRGPHLPIDHFFRSLAASQGARAIAVVLSGTGADGTLGAAEIKAVGGITFAQDEGSARHPGMPHSAAESGNVDFVLPPAEIAARLETIGAKGYFNLDVSAGADNDQFRRILAVVRSAMRVDFSQYRESTIRRRILRRMALCSEDTLAGYARRLMRERTEVDALYHDLLINVTSFFRDAEMFTALKERVFPEILKAKVDAEPIRIWVPGCSTGQEPYSIAISLIEFLDTCATKPAIQIFATDLSDRTALERARIGRYPESIEAEVGVERLKRFFRREGAFYRIEKSLRDLCVFARQNVAADPPFSHLDLISCRNLLIYLGTPLQKRVLPTFHYALNPVGFLALGSAETVGDHLDLFEPIDRTHKVYAKKSIASRALFTFPADDAGNHSYGTAHRDRPGSSAPGDYLKEADRLLLDRFSPAGVVVNADFEVLQYRGRTAPYLESPPGEPTTNLLKMGREGLFLELRSALAEAKQTHRPVRRDRLRLRNPEGFREVDLEVVPIVPPGIQEECFLVLFHERTGGKPVEPPAVESPAVPEGEELARLRGELTAVKDYLQSMVEQQDGANEELRSANEEILSSNEELQSTNEELETAKEELQSANEELTTVNEQLQNRNLELLQSNNDFNNLLSSTNLPLVMVDADLKIRLFTPSARRVMNLLVTDIGRPIGDIRPTVLIPDLETLISTVIRTTEPSLREVRDRDGRWHELRIDPYRTDKGIDGAVVVLFDVHELKDAEEKLREADRRKDEFLAIVAHELRNPIAPIRNAIEIVRIAADNPATLAQAHDVLIRQVRQLSRIVEDLIDVSRIAEGKVELRRRRIDAARMVESAIELCRAYLESCNHRLEVEIAPVPMPLEADPVRISQIIVNLINNAVKFTEPGGRIRIRLARVKGADGGEEAVLRITDSGVGIDSDLMPHVFEMFTQGARVLDGRRSGLGVGLALVHSLVHMHGGRIDVESAGRGQGSEFTVHLPIAESESGVEAVAEPVAPLRKSAATRRVLVVDDNVDQALSLGTLIRLLGHEVAVAHDGAAALDMAREFRPEIALIDLGMPGLNGYELAQAMRADEALANTVLVAQTGWGQPEDRERSQAAGFDQHLVKPLRPEDLQRVLESGSPAR